MSTDTASDPVASATSTSAKSPAKAASTSEMVLKGLLAVAESSQCPKPVAPYLVKAAPFVAKAVQGFEDSIPFFQRVIAIALEYWEKLKPYKPELLIPSFIGLVMCFFGGTYLTVIAAWEAFMMCGYESTKNSALALISDFEKVIEASKKDDAKDEDNDGVADVLQVSNKELLKRKVFLFLRTIDPNRLTVAVAGINAGFLAVLATLKLDFAKTITLGNSIGSLMEPPAHQFVLPVLERLLPKEYRKWAWPLISYTIRSVAMSIAWFLQRIISAFHSAIRGGLMFSRNIMTYLTEMDIYKINHEESVLDEILGYAVALLGLYCQLRVGFSVPFPLNVVLFPVTLLEYFLIWMVSK